MRVICRHGHFAFYPRKASDVSRFSNFYDVTLVRERDYFTFDGLEGADSYSLALKPWLNLPAIKTYEGMPWEVMKANDFVYSLTLGIVVPKLSIVGLVELIQVGFHYIVQGSLLQPGMRTILGRQILSYSGEIVDEGASLRISEYDYE